MLVLVSMLLPPLLYTVEAESWSLSRRAVPQTRAVKRRQTC